MTSAPEPTLHLGLDAGGTQTRWAVVDGRGALRTEGLAAALSGLQLHSTQGREHWRATLAEIAQAAGAQGGRLHSALAGVTGLDADQAQLLSAQAASTFAIAPNAVQAMNDIELACRAAFAPGAGGVVYAGTGSVAAFIDAQGTLHRAGGRGVVIDDAGGGHWIAREALRRIWRGEDECPGAWRDSALARRVFERIGGAEWAQTRHWVYGASRGEVGTLALAVATAARDDQDAAARALLHAAGTELGRLALALHRRFGALPLALAGRVFELHPAVEAGLRAALPAGATLHRSTLAPHHAAARLAAQGLPA